jgi:hypothetical protein
MLALQYNVTASLPERRLRHDGGPFRLRHLHLRCQPGAARSGAVCMAIVIEPCRRQLLRPLLSARCTFNER